MTRDLAVAILLVAPVVLAPSRALAVPAPPHMGPPAPAEASDAAVTRERLLVTCEPLAGGALDCHATATLTLRNPTPMPLRLQLGPDVEVQGGAAPDGVLALEPGQEVTAVTRGGGRVGPLSFFQWVMSATHARHPYFGRPREAGYQQPFFYYRTEPADWSSVPDLEVEVRWRGAASIEGDGWVVTREGGERVARKTVAPAVDERGVARIAFETPPVGLPVPMGVHVGIGRVERDRFLMRFGFEIEIHPIAFVAATVDTTFGELNAVATTLHVALPEILVLPSLGLGVGPVLRAAPDLAGALRVALDAVVFGVGFDASFDYYPKDGAFTTSLMARFGL